MSIEIVGLTRVRNEEIIIQETLDHLAVRCDAICVFDDASTDATPEICGKHPKVAAVIRNRSWDANRERAEYQNRQKLLEFGRKLNPAWFIYIDADERIVWDFQGYHDHDAVRMRLYDFYITPEDVNRPYTGDLNALRRFCGPEYREIIIMFRNVPGARYYVPDQREVALPPGTRVLRAGLVRHYGKAISIAQWEETCNYYARYFPKYSAKWAARKGKAVHTLSDFGRPLVRWEEIESGRVRGVRI